MAAREQLERNLLSDYVPSRVNGDKGECDMSQGRVRTSFYVAPDQARQHQREKWYGVVEQLKF
jgi:hypothetical protein